MPHRPDAPERLSSSVISSGDASPHRPWERERSGGARSRLTGYVEPSSIRGTLSQTCGLRPGSLQPLIRLGQRKTDALAQHRRTSAANLIMNLAPRITPAEVGQHNRFVFETISEGGDVVEMDVAILRRTLFMPRQDERALDHQHFRFEEGVVLRVAL